MRPLRQYRSHAHAVLISTAVPRARTPRTCTPSSSARRCHARARPARARRPGSVHDARARRPDRAPRPRPRGCNSSAFFMPVVDSFIAPLESLRNARRCRRHMHGNDPHHPQLSASEGKRGRGSHRYVINHATLGALRASAALRAPIFLSPSTLEDAH